MDRADVQADDGIFFALVDDERKIHEFLVSVLEEAGLMGRHVSFYDPLGLIEFLEGCESEPDVILLDINFEGSGLSGVEIIPFIRENYPYMPIILLTGMDSDAAREAQADQFTYFIPKPVEPRQLVQMILFYLGRSSRIRDQVASIERELRDSKDYQTLLEEELQSLQEVKAEGAPPARRDKGRKSAFSRMEDLVGSLLPQSEIMPTFFADLEDIYDNQYGLFKKIVEILVRFDIMDMTNPGLNIHKYKGTEHVYSARLSRKVRLFFYKSPQLSRKRLLRLDALHDTKGMDKWLKGNYATYAA